MKTPLPPQVNVDYISNLEHIIQQVSRVKKNNIDLGGGGIL